MPIFFLLHRNKEWIENDEIKMKLRGHSKFDLREESRSILINNNLSHLIYKKEVIDLKIGDTVMCEDNKEMFKILESRGVNYRKYSVFKITDFAGDNTYAIGFVGQTELIIHRCFLKKL